ncbi:MAG: peptidase [Solirubrobacterales bacterium]|nr:peptidase [Solirubrobacterales bacterium]
MPSPTVAVGPRSARPRRSTATAVLRTVTGVVAVLLLAAAAASPAQAWQPGPARYDVALKPGVPITMRDGTVLRADLHYPTDPKTGKEATGPFPVVLVETPYGPTATWAALSDQTYLVRRGYIVAVVAVRGTGASNGAFQLLAPQEVQDSIEVVSWAAKLPHSNGAVGMTGDSYLGITQLQVAEAIGPGSPLKAIMPIVAANDVYRDLFTQGGMLNVESDPALFGAVIGTNLAGAVLDGTLAGDPLGAIASHATDVPAFWLPVLRDIVSGGDISRADRFWSQRNPATHLGDIVRNGIPAYLVGGLFDVFQRGATFNVTGLQNAAAGRPPTAPMTRTQPTSGRYQALIGPWYHVTASTVGYDLNPTKLAWFDHWLKGENTGVTDTRTPVHVIDASGHRFDLPRVPLSPPTSYYLQDKGALGTEPPAATTASDQLVFTGATLRCDRQTEQWILGVSALALHGLKLENPCTVEDLSPPPGPAGQTYVTPPFAEATVLAGPIGATLYATSTTRDSSWVVKVDDLGPDGKATQLTSGALLGSYREIDDTRSWKFGHDYAAPFHPYTAASKHPVVPGEVTRYDIEVFGSYQLIEPGHRIRVTILSSDTPHLLAFPPDIPNLLGGVYAIQRTAANPSRIVLPLASPSELTPPARPRCTAPRVVTIRLPRGLRSGTVRVGARAVKVSRSSGRLRARIDLRHRTGRVAVRITGRTARGRTVRSTRTFRVCAENLVIPATR